MHTLKQIYQAINAVSQKVNSTNSILDRVLNFKMNEKEEEIADTQNATCELSEELDQRIADIENALCELSE